jgi:hypothetical protein
MVSLDHFLRANLLSPAHIGPARRKALNKYEERIQVALLDFGDGFVAHDLQKEG